MASQLVKWTKKRLFNVPEKLSVYGILDKFVLSDVSLNILKINKELNDQNYPFNVAFGNIAHVEFNLYLTQSQSVVLIKDVLIILCPASVIKNNGRLLKDDLNTIQLKLQKILTQILGKTNMTNETYKNDNETNEWMPWNEIIAWLFRYDPNFVIEINHFHLRFEEMDFPYCSIGLLWDSLCIKPGNKFWVFKWPDSEDPLSKLTLACDQTNPMQEKQESVSESFSETLENTINVGKAVFNGTVRNCRIYCKLNETSWVLKKVFKSMYKEKIDSRLPTTCQLISPEASRKRSKWVLHDRCLLLSNCSLEFQFGLKMAECGIEQCGGCRLTIAIIKPLRFQFNPSIVSILTRIYSLMDLIALRRILQSLKSLSLIEKKNISMPKRRWYLIQKFLPCWISKNPFSQLDVFKNTHIIGKQFFISCIRLSLLEFHLKHPKGRFHITSQFPFIRYPFQLLQKSFLLGKDRMNSHLSCITFQSTYTPMSYHLSPIPLEDEHVLQANELCSLDDFIVLGVHPPPLGYFFVCTNSYLQNALGSNFHDLANLINSKKVSDIVRWYLLAVRETEEILCYTWYCISKQLFSEQPPAWVIGEHHTFYSYVLKTLGIFFNDIKVIKYLSEIFDKNASDVQCKTNVFNLCGLVEEATIYERRHIKSKIYFTFSDTYKRIVSGSNSTFAKEHSCVNETMVNPWMNLQRSVHEKSFTEEDMKTFPLIPFETLVSRVEQDETKKYHLDMLEWEIPKMLRNITFGILIDTLEVSMSTNASQSATRLSYGVRIRALGLEFSCHLKLSLFLVCREMLLLNLCLDREGYIYQPKNNEELDPNKGFLIAAVTCNENLNAFTEKVTTLKSCETSQNEPWAVIGSSIPAVIRGDSDSNDDCDETRSEESKSSNKAQTFVKQYSDNYISFNTFCRSNSTEEDKFPNNLMASKSKKYWNTLTVSCVTSDCLKGIENLKLPLYLDIVSVTTDIHLFVRPIFFEEIYELFFQILTSYHTVREEKCMAPELNISKPFPRTTHDTITAALHEASWVMKSLLLCNDKGECFKKSSSFWLDRLSRILHILKGLQSVHSNYPVYYNDYILPTLSFEESENINNLHVQIRCVIPPVNVFLFPLTTFSSSTDSCVAELRLSENIFRLATVRRKKELHIVASSSQFYFTTRSNIQTFSALIPILYCIILNRVQEVRCFLNHHKQALKWNQNLSMCYVTKASVQLYTDALACIHTSLTKRKSLFKATSTIQLATNQNIKQP